jgi:DNA-binding CsgD family transcriptional regulator
MTTIADIAGSPLSDRELEILGMIARGSSSDRKIAAELFLSVRTVNAHVRAIYLKTGIPRSRAALALLWARLEQEAGGPMPGDQVQPLQSGASVRVTVDLDIELYRLLTTWAQGAAVELGRPRLTLTDSMRAMIRRTATDATVTMRVLETLRADARRSAAAAEARRSPGREQ